MPVGVARRPIWRRATPHATTPRPLALWPWSDWSPDQKRSLCSSQVGVGKVCPWQEPVPHAPPLPDGRTTSRPWFRAVPLRIPLRRRRVAGVAGARCPGDAGTVIADSVWCRVAWRVPFLIEWLVGHRPARLIAALVLRAAARSPHSYTKTARRVSPRLREENPRLVKIPDRWSQQHPTVRVRRGGLALELNLRDNLQAILFYAGVYEPDFRRHLLTHLHPGDVVADLGAHIGVHALAAARRLAQLGGGTVLAFEPAADSAAKMRAAAVRNDLDVEIVEAACSDQAGRLPLFADERYPVFDARCSLRARPWSPGRGYRCCPVRRLGGRPP